MSDPGYPAGVTNATFCYPEPLCEDPGCDELACDIRTVGGIHKLLCEQHTRDFDDEIEAIRAKRRADAIADGLFHFAADNSRRQARELVPK